MRVGCERRVDINDEEDDAPMWKNATSPPRLDSLLIANQLKQYCLEINRYQLLFSPSSSLSNLSKGQFSYAPDGQCTDVPLTSPFVCNEIKECRYFDCRSLFPRLNLDARVARESEKSFFREQRNHDGGLRWPRPRTGQAGPFSINAY